MKHIATFLFLLIGFSVFAQVDTLKQPATIGQDNRNQRTGRGLQIGRPQLPEVDTCEIWSKLFIPANAGAGKVLTSNGIGLATWQPSSGGGIAVSDSAWMLTGNSGTNPTVNFIGTIDNVALVFRTKNQYSGVIDPINGNTVFGKEAYNYTVAGMGNTAVGAATLGNLTSSANNNTAIGFNIGQLLTTGNNNTLIGVDSDTDNDTANNAIALGYQANAATNQFAISDSIENLKFRLNGQTNGYVLKTNGTTANWQPSSGDSLGLQNVIDNDNVFDKDNTIDGSGFALTIDDLGLGSNIVANTGTSSTQLYFGEDEFIITQSDLAGNPATIIDFTNDKIALIAKKVPSGQRAIVYDTLSFAPSNSDSGLINLGKETGHWDTTFTDHIKIQDGAQNGYVLTSDANGNATWQASAGGGVTSVSGTTNRITSTGGSTPVIDIAATYVGQASITTLGTVGTGTWQATPVVTTYGGTGLSSYTQGDLLYYDAGTVLSKLAKNTSATRYLSNTGTNNNPAWAQIDLTNGVTDVLPVANGGTGQGTYNSVLVLGKSAQTSTHTGSLTETVVDSLLIPANTVGVDDFVYYSVWWVKTGTAGGVTVKVYLNTSAAAGGTTIFNPGVLASNLIYGMAEAKVLMIKASNSTQYSPITVAREAPFVANGFGSVGGWNTANIDWTIDQYLVFTVQLGNTADVAGISGYIVEKK